MRVLGPHPHVNVSQEVSWGPGICMAAAHLGAAPPSPGGHYQPRPGRVCFLSGLPPGAASAQGCALFFRVFSAEPRVLALRPPHVPVMGAGPSWALDIVTRLPISSCQAQA